MVHGGGHHGSVSSSGGSAGGGSWGGGGGGGGGHHHHHHHRHHHQRNNDWSWGGSGGWGNDSGWSWNDNNNGWSWGFGNHHHNNYNSFGDYGGGWFGRNNRESQHHGGNGADYFRQRPWWNSLRRNHLPHRFSDASAREIDRGEQCCEKCCTVFCLAVWACICCGAASREQQVSGERGGGDVAERQDRHNRPNFGCLGAIFSVFTLIILVSMSSMDEKTWTLNAGESREVTIPWLTSHLVVTPTTTGAGGGVYTYEFPSCPPLTGPPISLEDSFDFKLAPGDYQYDYFYLNKHSVIHLDIQQIQGSTNVYILQGRDKLNKLEHPSDDDDFADSFAHNAVLKRFVTAGDHGTLSFSFNVQHTAVYTLVYDNLSPILSDVNVHYAVSLSTFDLQGKQPVCPDPLGSCSFGYSGHQFCLILQATAGQHHHGADDNVTIEVVGKRKWTELLLFSAIPLALGLLLVVARALASCDCQRSDYDPVEPNDLNLNATVDDDDDERPPATAPDYRPAPSAPAPVVAPSAPPMEAPPQAAIPVAQAQVIGAATSDMVDTSGIPLVRAEQVTSG